MVKVKLKKDGTYVLRMGKDEAIMLTCIINGGVGADAPHVMALAHALNTGVTRERPWAAVGRADMMRR